MNCSDDFPGVGSTLTLGQASVYSGNTAVSNGTLALGLDNVIPDGGGAVTSVGCA